MRRHVCFCSRGGFRAPRSSCRLAHHHLRLGLALPSRYRRRLRETTTKRTVPNVGPTANHRHQRRTFPNPTPSHHSLSFRPRTLRRRLCRRTGTNSALRPPALRPRRMPQTRHGTPRLGRGVPHRKGRCDETSRQPRTCQNAPGTLPPRRGGMVHESRTARHRRLSRQTLSRNRGKLRGRWHSLRLYSLSRTHDSLPRRCRLSPPRTSRTLQVGLAQAERGPLCESGRRCGQGRAPLGQTQLLARREICRPSPRLFFRMERPRRRESRRSGVARKRLDGLALPDDVF